MIEQRGRSSWMVSFRAGRNPETGQPIRVRETVRGTKKDAERRLTQLLRDHDVSGLVPDRETTVEAFSTVWLEHVAHRVKPSTLKRYQECLLLHVCPMIGTTKLSEVRPASVQVVVDKVLASRSPRTAVNVYRVMSEMLNEALRWNLIPANPARAIRPPRAPRPPLNVPDAETCSAILSHVRGTDFEGPVTIALGTGMRLGEITALRWHDVDLDRRVARVTATLAYAGGEFSFTAPKTYRARRAVDLPWFVVDYLRRQRRAQTERRLAIGELWEDFDIVLDGVVGRPIPPWSVSHGFAQMIGAMGLPKIRFHDLRHAHASRLLEANVHPKIVSERLGHASTAFTMDTYSSVIPTLGRTAADAIENLLG
jgi:integrase